MAGRIDIALKEWHKEHSNVRIARNIIIEF